MVCFSCAEPLAGKIGRIHGPPETLYGRRKANIQIDQSLIAIHPRFPRVLSTTLIRRGATNGFRVGQQFRTAVKTPANTRARGTSEPPSRGAFAYFRVRVRSIVGAAVGDDILGRGCASSRCLGCPRGVGAFGGCARARRSRRSVTAGLARGLMRR